MWCNGLPQNKIKEHPKFGLDIKNCPYCNWTLSLKPAWIAFPNHTVMTDSNERKECYNPDCSGIIVKEFW